MSRRALPLADRLTALREAVEAADGSLPPAATADARALLAKAGARVALGDATVVALAGATGSGKSTLFNALVGAEVSQPGVRRPTTGTAHAAVWGADAATPGLLDWLGVPRRHGVEDGDPALSGLVLLDLPDHDSTRVEHRLEVDRLVGLVDVLVWVLDPQKYADAAVHDRYLVPYARHAGSLLVVLNQVDRLSDPQPVLADLRRLLDREGLGAVPVLAASGRTGEGLDALRAELARRVAARRAASERLTADVRTVAAGLEAQCGGGGDVGRGATARLVDALADAAGVPTVVRAVEGSVRARGRAATGWPALRWTGRLRADPLRRLRLAGPPDERVRTSLSPAGGVQSARLDTALRAVRDEAGEGLPEGWRAALRAEVEGRSGGLADRLDRAVAGTDTGAGRSPRWWAAVGLLQWLLLLAALVGGLWLLALVALAYLQLDDVLPLPEVSGLPLPTLLLGAGLLSGALLAVLVRPFVRAGARRRARAARARLRARVEAVAQEEVLAPVAAQRAAHDRFCAAVRRAGG